MSETYSRQSTYLLLKELGGSYLRNPIPSPPSCKTCATACGTFPGCYPCTHAPTRALPDLTGFVTYAARGTQAGSMMHGYKAQYADQVHRALVTLLLWHGIQHLPCAQVLTGQPLTHLGA